MRGAPHLLFLPLLLAAAWSAPSAAAQDTTLALDMLDENGTYFFRASTGGARNPTLLVAAGSTVRVDVANLGSLDHNLVVGAPVDRGTPCCQESGERATIELQVPADASGTIPYWCSLHRELGMAGVLRVAPAGGIPAVEIVRPVDQATVPPTFTVEVRVANFTLGTQGHVHYLVDGAEGRPGWDTNETRFTASALDDGFHHVRVELVGGDHRPLDPPVVRETFVFVSASAPPEIVTSTPSPTPTPVPVEDESFLPGPGALGALLTGCAAALWMRRRAHR